MKKEAHNGEVINFYHVQNRVFKATGISGSSLHKVLEKMIK
jgi:hypothetical protein